MVVRTVVVVGTKVVVGTVVVLGTVVVIAFVDKGARYVEENRNGFEVVGATGSLVVPIDCSVVISEVKNDGAPVFVNVKGVTVTVLTVGVVVELLIALSST